MKAMSMPILVVVTAIIILVVALVILTIFGSGLGNIQTITQAESQCATLGASTCRSTGSLPPTWGVQNMLVSDPNGGQRMDSCAVLLKCGTGTKAGCSGCNYPTPPTV